MKERRAPNPVKNMTVDDAFFDFAERPLRPTGKVGSMYGRICPNCQKVNPWDTRRCIHCCVMLNCKLSPFRALKSGNATASPT
jgi:hypothetical protein